MREIVSGKCYFRKCKPGVRIPGFNAFGKAATFRKSSTPARPIDDGTRFTSSGASSAVLTRFRLSVPLSLPHVRLATVGLVLALVAGAALRTVWVTDMEYKADEAWTFLQTQHVGVDQPVPAFGMPTSYDLRHPGGTVWVFLVIAKVFGVTTPTDLGRACQVLNTLAILLVVGFAYRCVPDRQREPWLWAAALASVNPLAVVFHRKIWPPSMAPLFTTVALIAWWHRGRRTGAFFWGLCSVLVGQIHPAGLFLALGVAAWTFLIDRKSVRWGYWVAGCVLATLTLVPWLLYALDAQNQHPTSQRYWSNLVNFRFWINWVTEVNGASLHYTLGKDFTDFLARPVVGGVPTYAVGVLHVLMFGTGLTIVGLAVWRAFRVDRRVIMAEALGKTSATGLAVSAVMFGFGIAFTLTRLPVHRHYMCLTFPIMYLWLAQTALANRERVAGWLTRGRALLAAACLLQFAVSAGFIGYIHANPRPIRGDYGTPYRAQDVPGFTPRSDG